MRSLWLLTIKNLKLLVRSKGSALIIIFAPLLIILLLGLSYNTSSKYGLNIGVHASSFTEDVNSFIALLQEDEFTITRYEENVDTCIDDIKQGNIHTCLIIPESLNIQDNNQKEIVFYVDPSKIHLVSVIQNTVKEKFNIKSQEISESLAQETLSRLQTAKENIAARKTELEQVKSQSSTASSNSAAVQGKLGAIDVSDPNTRYNVSLIDGFTKSFSDAKDNVEKALEALENLNATTGQKAAVKRHLDAAEDNLGNQTGGTDLKGLFDNIQSDLDQAVTAISSSKTEVESVTSTLQQVITNLDALLTGLSEIQNALEAQRVTEADTLTSPLITRIERVSETGTYLNYLFPSLLVLVLMFSSLLLGTTLVMIEKNSPAFLRNFFLPIRKITFMISIYLTNLILIIIELVVILGISIFFLKDSLNTLPTVALILFIAASVFTFLGMAIGYIFSSEETGVLASISLGSVLLLLSGTILPIEGVSSVIRRFLYFNPFVIAEKLIREVFIFTTPLKVVWLELVILLSYAVVLFITMAIVESIMHRHIVSRFMRKHHRQHRHKEKQHKADV